MKIIALEVPVVPEPDFSQIMQHLKSESQRVWDLMQSGELREIYRRTDDKGHVLIFECATVEEAKKLVDSLPLVQQKLIAFDLIPLGAYPGLARLFAEA